MLLETDVKAKFFFSNLNVCLLIIIVNLPSNLCTYIQNQINGKCGFSWLLRENGNLENSLLLEF